MSSNGNKPSVSHHQKSTSSTKTLATSNNLISVKFEVEGKVQKVHFRKYTQRKASALGLRGWCQNSKHGTVLGFLEGPEVQIEMIKLKTWLYGNSKTLRKDWLRRVGSPKSKITGVHFNQQKVIQGFTFSDFAIKLD